MYKYVKQASTDGSDWGASFSCEKKMFTDFSFLPAWKVRDIIWGAVTVILQPGGTFRGQRSAKHGGWEGTKSLIP